MAKSRKRGGDDVARPLEEARDALFDMEEPLAEIRALLTALDLMGDGMRHRGDSGSGYAVAIVANCAMTRLDVLRKH